MLPMAPLTEPNNVKRILFCVALVVVPLCLAFFSAFGALSGSCYVSVFQSIIKNHPALHLALVSGAVFLMFFVFRIPVRLRIAGSLGDIVIPILKIVQSSLRFYTFRIFQIPLMFFGVNPLFVFCIMIGVPLCNSILFLRVFQLSLCENPLPIFQIPLMFSVFNLTHPPIWMI